MYILSMKLKYSLHSKFYKGLRSCWPVHKSFFDVHRFVPTLFVEVIEHNLFTVSTSYNL